jgi:hypothetical protein
VWTNGQRGQRLRSPNQCGRGNKGSFRRGGEKFAVFRNKTGHFGRETGAAGSLAANL